MTVYHAKAPKPTRNPHNNTEDRRTPTIDHRPTPELAVAASNSTMQHPTTPQNKPKRPRCTNCPCQGAFQSNESITSAIKSEADTSSLIDWLSGQHLSDTPNNNCSNRLHASIVILNAIRDSCRVYIEASVSSNSEKTPKPNELAKKKQQQTIWEDSFPALSSAASTVTPTILFGRKKEAENSDIDRNDISEKQTQKQSKQILDNNGGLGSVQKQQSVNKPKTKKKIKPVTISPQNVNVNSAWGSLSASNSTSAWGKSVSQSKSNGAAEVNVVSFPSQPVEQKEQINGCDSVQSSNVKKVSNDVGLNVTLKSEKGDARYSLLDGESSSRVDQSDTLDKDSSSLEFKQLSIGNDSPTKLNQAVNESETETQLVRLSSIYATILKNQLAPYLLLELHLLVRLISISENTLPNLNEKSDLPFRVVFNSQKSCRKFGASTILAIEPIVLNLGHDILKVLVSLTSLRKHCPTLTPKIEEILEKNKMTLIFDSGQKALGTNANTAHLTLPFDHARDSRHNFKTIDLNRLFKEREELRDKFLFQLRAFQDVKGRLMDEEVSSKIISNIEDESRKMLQHLPMGNLDWFVNFFSDLLLQIGLVPIGETDIDVLNQVSDQQRLQKLHKRFTTKGTQAKKYSSSRKLVIDEKTTSSSFNRSLPEQSFNDHQEFFAIFLKASDSYKFNTRLKQRLSQLIVGMTAANETKGLCQRIAKTMLLAKFLGLLVFSPNWTVSESESTVSSTRLSYNYEDVIGPINLIEQLERAWREYRLVMVVPWIAEFLKMMTWTAESKRCQYYRKIFAMLWSIKYQCISSLLHDQSSLQTNMLAVSLQLDNLFSETIGLEYSWNLPAVTLPRRHSFQNSNDTPSSNSSSVTTLSPIDILPLWLSKSFLFLTTSYVQDIFEIVQHFQSANTSSSKLGTSTAKKVRPRSISTGPLKDFVESNSWQRLSPMRSLSPVTGSPWSSGKTSSADPGSEAAIKDKLIDTFFHQHNELQQLCETTIDQVIKNFSRSTLQNAITPIFKEKATSYGDYFSRSPSLTLNEYVELLQSLDVTANMKAREEMKSEFGRTIRGTLELLSPPNTQPRVREIACSLALRHASNKGDQIIRSFISEEKRKLIDEFARKESKVKAGVPLKAASNRRNVEGVQRPLPSVDLSCFIDLTDLLSRFDTDDAVETLPIDQLDKAVEVSMDFLSQFFIGTDPSPCVQDFQSQVVQSLNECLSSSKAKQPLLFAVLKATNVLSRLGRMGYLSTATICEFEQIINDIEKLNRLTNYTLANSSTHTVATIDDLAVGTFLFQLVDGSIIRHTFLEDALLTSLTGGCDQNGMAQICEVTLNKLAINLGFDGWRDDGFVIMVRLQKIMT